MKTRIQTMLSLFLTLIIWARYALDFGRHHGHSNHRSLAPE